MSRVVTHQLTGAHPGSRSVTVGLIQMKMESETAHNLSNALEKIAEAAARGAQIVCLPELFMSRYFCQTKDDKPAFDSAEQIPSGPTASALSDAAKKHQIVLVGGSLFEVVEGPTSPGFAFATPMLRGARKFFNTAPVFDADGSFMGAYRKTHIPEDILYHEKQYFSTGDTGIKVFHTRFGNICPLICYDQWYPEASRIAALKGAEIIFYPTAIGLIDQSVEANITGDWEQMWRNAQLGHAASNNVYICALNRVGKEGAIAFWGGSFVADPSSAILAQAGHQEEIVIVTCDLGRVKALQDAWMFLKNRRPDTYEALTQ
ncbi:carbon-nitrogen hydrolase [Candidatus Peregrinibacteria bacterium]|nr:carbon-nitrogen hydrolase [Candidatus Peregrinibacteria bacterium]